MPALLHRCPSSRDLRIRNGRCGDESTRDVRSFFVTAAAVHATQFTYSNTGGTVTQPSGTSLSITGVTLSSPAGTVSMSCLLSYTTPVYPYYSEWSCIGGSVSFQSTDGLTAFSGYFPSAFFALQKVVPYHRPGNFSRPIIAQLRWQAGRHAHARWSSRRFRAAIARDRFSLPYRAPRSSRSR